MWNEKLKREIPKEWDNCTLEYYLIIKNGRDHKHLGNGIYPVYGSGGDRDKIKRAELGRVGSEIADLVIITSDNPRHEDPMAIIKDIVVGIEKTNYLAIENRSEAIRLALKMAEPGDVVVLAGKGHETYQINNEGVIHFDEREVVDEILSGK